MHDVGFTQGAACSYSLLTTSKILYLPNGAGTSTGATMIRTERGGILSLLSFPQIGLSPP